MTRCGWCTADPLYIEYHDHEWGIPVHDDQKLFEMLILEGAQAGLSWITILKRREGYRAVFDGFNPELLANYTDEALEAKLMDERIIRNRLKVFSVRQNARVFLEIQKTHGSFDAFIWQFTAGKTIDHACQTLKDVPTTTAESDAMSKALKKLGFKFVGSTICYAYMQAVGMVNDHTMDCHAYRQG